MDPDLDRRLSELMRRAQDGDRAAYEALLVEAAALVRTFVRKRLAQADGVEDVVQETLLSIHSDRHTYDPERRFRPWMYAIARHRLLDFVGKQRRRDENEIGGDAGLREPLRRIVARLGIKKHLTPYAFRRSFNSLGVGTVPSEVLRKTVGHVSHEMTEHYLAVDLAGKRQLADGVAAKVFSSNDGEKMGKTTLPTPAADPMPTPSSPASLPN